MNTKTIKINKRPALIKELATIRYSIKEETNYMSKGHTLQDEINNLNKIYNTPHPITGNYFWTIKMIREQLKGAKL